MAITITNKNELTVGQKTGGHATSPCSVNTQSEDLVGRKSCKRSCKMCKWSNKAAN